MSRPMIPDALWRRYGARVVPLAKGETLFDQGTTASSFHQVKSGRVKMVSYNEQGREFVQGMFTEGQTFGEPPFFNDVPYPAAAMAVADSKVRRCGREDPVARPRDRRSAGGLLTRSRVRRLRRPGATSRARRSRGARTSGYGAAYRRTFTSRFSRFSL